MTIVAKRLPVTNYRVKHFSSLSQFTSKEDFNKNVEMWLADHKKHMTVMQHMVLKRLSKFAKGATKKYPDAVLGVANMSKGLLLEAINTYDARHVGGMCERTVRRAIQKFEKIGIITVFDGKRWNKSDTANVYVFNRYQAVNKDGIVLNNDTIVHGPKSQKEAREPSESEVASRVKEELRIVESLSPLEANIIYKSNNIKDIKNTYEGKDLAMPTPQKSIGKVQKKKGKNLHANSSFYAAIQNLYNKHNVSKEKRVQLNSIVYGSIKKYKEHLSAMGGSDLQLENLVYEAVSQALKLPKSKIQKNIFATVSTFIKRKVLGVEGFVSKGSGAGGAARGGRVEMVPDWFADRNKAVDPQDDERNKNIDFEAEREKILKMLGKQAEQIKGGKKYE